MASRRRIGVLAASVVLLAGACSTGSGTEPPADASPSPTTGSEETGSRFDSFGEADALAASEPVDFRATDGVRLEGRMFGSGEVGVVLSHMRPGDQSQWLAFAALLADEDTGC